MDCQEAKELIDLRLHESSGDDSSERADWSALEGHLGGCLACADEWIELQRTRALLVEVASDKPNTQEVESMWESILTANAVSFSSNRQGLWRFAAALTSMAAVLGIAFALGQSNIETSWNEGRIRYNVDAMMSQHALVRPTYDQVFEQRVKGRATSAKSARQASIPRREADKPLALQRRSRSARGASSLGLKILNDASSGMTEPPTPADDALRFLGGLRTPDFAQEAPLIDIGADESESDSDRTYAMDADSDGDGAPYSSIADATDLAFYADEMGEPAGPDGEVGPPMPEVAIAADASGRLTHRTSTKVIKTGTLSVEVASYAQAVERVTDLIAEHGASIANVSTREQVAGAMSSTLVIRVAPERFDALFAALKTVGRVEAENAKVADVSADYVDVEARIASLEITQQRLAELITNKSFVDKMSALLEVEREMTRVRSQLEQLQGRRRVMADRIAQATITIALHEPARTVPTGSLSVEVAVVEEASTALARELSRFGGRLSSGNTTKRNDGTLVGNYQVRISLAHFSEFLRAITDLGRVENRQISNHDLSHASAAWAGQAQCNLAIVLFERTRQLPSGSMRIEVDELAPSLAQLDTILDAHGGSILSNHSTQQSDGSSTAELSLRVPGGRFAALSEALESLGRMTEKTVTGEAGLIVGGAADVPCQLSLTLAEQTREVPNGRIILEVAEFGAARQQLSALVGETNVRVLSSSSEQRTDGSWSGYFRLGIASGEMDTVVTRLESLGRVVRRQISGIGLGDLSRTNPNAIGLVELTLAEKAAINPAPERAGDSLRAHLRDGLAGLYRSIGFIAYGMIVMAPWLILAVLLAWLLTRVWRRRQALPVDSRVS